MTLINTKTRITKLSPRRSRAGCRSSTSSEVPRQDHLSCGETHICWARNQVSLHSMRRVSYRAHDHSSARNSEVIHAGPTYLTRRSSDMAHPAFQASITLQIPSRPDYVCVAGS